MSDRVRNSRYIERGPVLALSSLSKGSRDTLHRVESLHDPHAAAFLQDKVVERVVSKIHWAEPIQEYQEMDNFKGGVHTEA